MNRMNRLEIRELKRAVLRHHDAAAMHMLLQRSVRFRHKRLALLRCLQAEHMGMQIAPEILLYCQQAADKMTPEMLANILQQARSLLIREEAALLAAESTP